MRKGIILFLFYCITFNVCAQDTNDDFQSFRNRVLSDYQGFRKRVLDDYATFLNGIWNDYEVFTGRKLRTEPKPVVQPKKDEDEPKPEPQDIVPEEVVPAEPVVEDNQPTPKPTVIPPTTMVSFDWCGMTMQLPDAKISGNLNELSKESLVNYLEELNNSRLEMDVIPQIINVANACNFNDWCLFLFIESYVKKIKANANNNTRNFICWYLMVSFDFDVRISFNGPNLFYLVPFKQIVYSRNYIKINDKPYYVWGEGNFDKEAGIYSPEIPENSGSSVNMVITKHLNIPYRAKKFTHTFSGRTLSVEVNENLIQVMKRFPQIPIPAYAVSKGDRKLRTQVLTQIKQFIQGMNELEAANFILQFIQSFAYATDDEQFGYEKPFFVEEILAPVYRYHPYNGFLMFFQIIVVCRLDATVFALHLNIKETGYKPVVFHQVRIEQRRDGIIALQIV